MRTFYDLPQDASEKHDARGTTKTSSNRAVVLVDRPFLLKVWHWLGRHPDTSIGKEHQYDGCSLDDIETRFPGYTSIQLDNAVKFKQPAPLNHYSETLEASSRTPPASNIDQKEGPRIYVNDERTSIAICGHPPDVSRVHPSEWELMLHIAAAGSKGIVQGDLVRASGQDKRSVPKRTDSLHEKGYIEKRSIYLRGNKSSQLYLRRFAAQDQPGEHQQDAASTVAGQLTIRRVIRQMFDLLRNNPLIPQEDLRNALGMMDAGRVGIFSAIIKHFGKQGCIKRLMTSFGPTAQSNRLRNCIQFLKDPDDDNSQLQNIAGFDVDQDIEALASNYGGQAESPSQVQISAGVDTAVELEQVTAEPHTSSQRILLPSWNPDRILANVLFEAAQNTGVSGLKNNVSLQS